jgi:hypothetical protein
VTISFIATFILLALSSITSILTTRLCQIADFSKLTIVKHIFLHLLHHSYKGAFTLSITTFSIMTLRIKALFAIFRTTLSITTLSITTPVNYAECRILFIVMPKVIILSVDRLNVVMLSVVMLNVVMLNVVILNVVLLGVVMLKVVQ